jgi:nicotinamide-nucleotide adenylyltransferase
MTTALFITRAQPFHLGHLRVIRDILKKNDRIVIAIGSAQAKNTLKNPFTAREREEMVDLALKASRVKNYEIVRIPDLFNDQLWVARVNRVCRFDAVYSMNPWTVRCFRKAGIRVRRHAIYRKCLSGTEIRKRIRQGKKWEALVPGPVSEYLKGIDGVKRLKSLKK